MTYIEVINCICVIFVILNANQPTKSRSGIILRRYRSKQYRRFAIYAVHAPNARTERVRFVFAGCFGSGLSDGFGFRFCQCDSPLYGEIPGGE